MKKRPVVVRLAAVVLILLAFLMGCPTPDQPADTAPPEALSYDQLMANLDALEAQAAQGVTPGGMVFALPEGTQLSLSDLSAYLSAIKTQLAEYVRTRMGGSPYLVLPVKLSWTAGGKPASGLMWVPFTWGRRLNAPLISYQHGTQVFRQTTPSRFNANPLAVLSSPDLSGAFQNYVECIAAALMASAGYIVVMPDYPGFGDSPEIHPYVTSVLGNSVKEIIGAAQLALTGRVKPNGKVFLTGYSEGGYVTMVGARALQGVPGIAVSGVVPCDGAYDLSGVMREQMVGSGSVKVPSYLPYAISGYHVVYPDQISYTALLQSPYDTYPGYFNGSFTNAQIDALGMPEVPSTMLQPLAITDLLAPGKTVYNLLAANNGWVGLVPMMAPIYLVHCPDDDVVSIKNAERAWYVLTQEMGFPETLVQIVPVPAVPLIDTILGNVHVAAYPTAMLAAFTLIDGINRGY